MPKKYTLILCCAIIFTSAAVWVRRTRLPMIDPLKGSGLADNEIRLFRYLLSLHEYSGINMYDVPASRDEVRAFNKTYGARICRVCERVFPDLDGACPYYHGPTVELTKEGLMQYIESWETFRREYCTHIGLRTMTRLWAIKMYWLLKHPMER